MFFLRRWQTSVRFLGVPGTDPGQRWTLATLANPWRIYKHKQTPPQKASRMTLQSWRSTCEELIATVRNKAPRILERIYKCWWMRHWSWSWWDASQLCAWFNCLAISLTQGWLRKSTGGADEYGRLPRTMSSFHICLRRRVLQHGMESWIIKSWGCSFRCSECFLMKIARAKKSRSHKVHVVGIEDGLKLAKFGCCSSV